MVGQKQGGIYKKRNILLVVTRIKEVIQEKRKKIKQFRSFLPITFFCPCLSVCTCSSVAK